MKKTAIENNRYDEKLLDEKISYYMSLPYEEIITPAKEGGYVAYIPRLKGCITQAETKEEIVEMLEDAKLCWLEAALEDGVKIPEPLSDEEFSGKFSLRIPKRLHRHLAQEAKKEGVSLNQFAMCLLAEGIGAQISNSISR